MIFFLTANLDNYCNKIYYYDVFHLCISSLYIDENAHASYLYFNKRSLGEWIKTYPAFQSQFSENFSKVFSFLSPCISVYVSWRNLLVFLHRKTYLIPKESEHWDSRMKLLFFTAQFPEGYFLPLCCHKTKGQILFSCC